jgi:hypothetical protein
MDTQTQAKVVDSVYVMNWTTIEIICGSGPRPGIIRNAYYKHELMENGKPRAFMSGLELPLDDNGRLDGLTFESCDFHPCCPDITSLGGIVV